MAPLNASLLKQFSQQLNEQNEVLLREVRNELDNPGDRHRIDLLNREPGDPGDESMASALADFNMTRLDRHIRDMRDIEAAFRRIKDGEYGICTDCGNDIDVARLRAYPTAKRCIVCQEKREREYAHEDRPKL